MSVTLFRPATLTPQVRRVYAKTWSKIRSRISCGSMWNSRLASCSSRCDDSGCAGVVCSGLCCCVLPLFGELDFFSSAILVVVLVLTGQKDLDVCRERERKKGQTGSGPGLKSGRINFEVAWRPKDKRMKTRGISVAVAPLDGSNILWHSPREFVYA